MNDKDRTGRTLERRVADLYRQMGAYGVGHDYVIDGNQIDVYLMFETARLVHRVAVEVKDHTAPVGVRAVNDFALVALLLRGNRHIDEGVIVSLNDFTRPARLAAGAHGIKLFTIADLEALANQARQSHHSWMQLPSGPDFAAQYAIRRPSPGKPVTHRLTLLFDFDGTLVDMNKRLAYESVVSDYALDPFPGLADQLLETDQYLCDQGVYDRKHTFKRFPEHFSDTSLRELCEAFWLAIRKHQTVKDGAEDVLGSLRNLGHNLICVTDTDGTDGNKTARVEATGIRHFFSRLFVGSTDGLPPKGEQDYVRYVLHEIGNEPSECVMIGDKPRIDLVPAWELGMPSILVRDRAKGNWRVSVNYLAQLGSIISGLEADSHRPATRQ